MLSFRNGCLFMTLSLACSYTIFSQASLTSNVQKKFTIPEYVDRYKDVAIREMERSGIPASITLAQGLHESGCGNSRLATEANNHFGIKCHKNWAGETFFAWDDDPTESCFRKYPNAELSYIDHTDFLMKERYASLFSYKLDYEKWAHGLKSCGYATDPEYAQKIIDKIQKHKLFEYDLVLPQINPDSQKIIADTKTEDVYVKPENLNRKLRKQSQGGLFFEYKKGLFQQNGVTYAIARKNETALEFAARFDIPYRKFLTFNDMVDGDQLIENQYCYLNHKKTKYKGKELFHKVSKNETMYEIAQFYGLRLDVLLERNLLTEGQEPKNGESILLNDKAQKAPVLRDPNLQVIYTVKTESAQDNKKAEVANANNKISEVPAPEEDEVVANEVSLLKDVPMYADLNTTDPVNTIMNFDSKSNEELVFPASEPENFSVDLEPKVKELTPVLSNSKKQNTENDKTNAELTSTSYTVHTVAAQETLSSIGRKYGVDWKKISEFNQLKSLELYENQKIKIPNK